MNIIYFKTKIFTKKLKRGCRKIWNNIALFGIVLLLADIAIGALFLIKYFVLTPSSSVEVKKEQFEINKNLMKEIEKEWEKHDKGFKKAFNQNLRNPFENEGFSARTH